MRTKQIRVKIKNIRFLLFEISNVFWSIIQQSLNLRICLFYICPFKKAKKLFLTGQIVIQSQSFQKYLEWRKINIWILANFSFFGTLLK